MQEQAAALGLDAPLGRGHSALWFDWNRDGLLDVLQSNAKRPDGLAPTSRYQQTANGFRDVSESVGLQVSDSSRFAQLADLSDDGSLDLVIQGTYTYPLKVYDTTL